MDSKVAQKAFAFALRIMKLDRYLLNNRCDRSICRQVLRSGTSIGANVEEALAAQSRKDFIAKLSIAKKECNETKYWLRLLRESGYLEDTHFNSIYPEAEEIYKMLTSIILTTQKNS
ncbi:MAG TPA: four helix bundle protein [Candidatus Cloacimonadota bacterium]|mgnify:CR=1 FL=1|nr:four helix bundle protein [Candidatus Cloacimonadota bacterium]HOR58610.1 four helix bundle protein [Candidatus Cloacimonadota bacterium]